MRYCAGRRVNVSGLSNRSSGTSWASRTLRTSLTLRASQTLRTSLTLRASRTLRTSLTLRASQTLRATLTLRASRTLRTRQRRWFAGLVHDVNDRNRAQVVFW